ncbi:hypothetical protein KUCAC02_001101 [Chaenocephalus aceratus]|uniref:Uncharacterized protein n=1 Tax=Chaenocephalus aceratus TaxID=36190 RepID=A0ACB9XXH2_CHAAC|nr:hypothetical protein KUCAC02_001101 [Chaenocephalus aceratus]
MASECTQETILNFLKQNGGKVKNADFIAHFKAVFPEQPEKKAAARQTFKNNVDKIAFVKSESGVKYVCVKKKFLGSEKRAAEECYRGRGGDGAPHGTQARADDAADSALHTPGSGYGNDSQVRVPHVFPSETIHPDITADNNNKCREFVCTGEMGNRGSIKREKSRKEQERNAPHVPEISVTEASPLPAEGPVFTLPGPVHTAPLRDTLSLEGLQEQSDEEERMKVSMVLRNSVYLSSRSDGDSASGMDDESRTWEWGSLSQLLSTDPSLVLKKDFVSGFTCLHWAAKQDKPELIALIINFAKQHHVPISVDIRSNTGYTPLHIAAMHNHMEVVKLLVGPTVQTWRSGTTAGRRPASTSLTT